ncbi:MAG TPA: CDGSH iron-sulfur domain-containing protein [Anaerolineae bacterium]|nr:CDGSH iron-sulfur domain-containing protein [Anaerolineae bacterium]
MTKPHIKIEEHGPYVVSGSVKLTRRIRVRNQAGDAVAWQAGEDFPAEGETYKLCRCGQSDKMPFCDGHHEHEVKWTDGLTADRAPGETRRQLFEGTGIIMTDDNSLCAGFEFCDRFGGVWDEINQTADPAVRKQLMEQIPKCPSGRLQYLLKPGGEPQEINYEPMIAVIPDASLWVLGSIPIETPDGFTYEVRNRQLLCRCGQSQNKPFCDGTHWDIHFKAE